VVLDSSIEVWPWFAIAGGLGLLAEWMMYGSFRRSLRSLPLLVRHKSSTATEVRQ